MAKTLTVNIHIAGARQTLAAISRLPKDASGELRRRTLALSESLARDVRTAAVAEGDQAALMAPTVRANRDRVPSVSAGGAKRVGRNRVPAWRLLFASEFGMNIRSGWYHAAKYATSTGRQYKPHLGRGSYWFFRAVEQHEPEIARTWTRVADDILRAFSRGGD
jgi:hypothetical protein